MSVTTEARLPLVVVAISSMALLAIGGAVVAFKIGMTVGARTMASAPQTPPQRGLLPTAAPANHPSPVSQIPPAATSAACPSGTLVSNAADLASALSAVKPGETIVLAPGTYSGQFVASVSGSATAPITLCGPREAVIEGGSIRQGYSFYLNAVDWWRVIGFSIEGGQKGLLADHANHDLIHGLYVHDIGDEGIHLREFSSDDTVDGNTVRNTGLLRAKYGEGIYVGTANSNWCRYTSCKPDNSDHDVISNNDIGYTTAENIDIKEGTTGGTIEHNHLSGDGMAPGSASAWINVKGNGWTITGNTGIHSLQDGFQVHQVYAGWGEQNVFRSNHAEVDGPGYGYYVQSVSLAAVVGCDNTVAGAARGLSNVPCGG